MKKLLISISVLSLLLSPLFLEAQMVSATYGIQTDSLNSGGLRSISNSYGVEDTAGETATGKSNSSNFGLFEAGYQGMRPGIAAPTSVAPSVPANLAATAMSVSTIELTWQGSTDDYFVSGYYIYRDGVRIADTPEFPHEYLDTGLAATTAHTYEVSAFDNDGNESARSDPASATTFATPISTPTQSSHHLLTNFVLTPDSRSALVSFNTPSVMRAELAWNSPNDSGAAVQDAASLDHQIVLKNLLPNTSYVLKLTLIDALGAKTVFDNISFLTLKAPGVTPPLNVTHFKVTPTEKDLVLSWQNSADPRATRVRIARSDSFYPGLPMEGGVIFEGTGTSFTDTNIEAGKVYYYTIFAEDLAGNFSSGSVTAGKVALPGEVVTPTAPLETLPQASQVDPQISALKLSDFLFIQNGDSVAIPGDIVSLDGSKNTTVALTYYRVPAVLKTIAVTLTTTGANPESFTFVLRANRDKTRYEATIGPLGETNNYKLQLTIIDFKNQGLKKIPGTLQVLGLSPSAATIQKLAVNPFLPLSFIMLFILLVALGLALKKIIFRPRQVVGVGLLLLLLLPSGAKAAINQEINYQGRLVDGSSVAVTNGSYNMRFNLYTSATGGASLWTETLTSTNRVPVTSGLFSVMLGSTTPFSGVNFNQTLYLGVEIGGTSGVPTWDGEMTPRKIIGAVPAALVADTLDNLDSTQFLRSDTSGTLTGGLVITGTLSSGLINGQTISSAANFSGSLTATAGLTTLSNLLLTGSSTLQNVTVLNSTSTNATTTVLSLATLFRSGTTDGCATWAGGILGTTGTVCGSGGGGSAYAFPLAGNATSTLTQFLGGVTSSASSTISALTVSNGTTTNATSTTLAISGKLTLGGVNVQTTLNNLVPYTGATANVDLGSNALSVGGGLSIDNDLSVDNGSIVSFFSDLGSTRTGALSVETPMQYSFLGSTFNGVLNFSGVNSSDKVFTFQNTSGTVGLLQASQTWTGANILNNITLSTTTNATTTSLFATTASSTNLFSTALSTGLITSGLINGQTISSAASFSGTLTATAGLTTLSNLLLSGSSTLQNFTSVNATSTNFLASAGTITNLLSTTANLTDLTASAFSGAGLTNCSGVSQALTWNSGMFGCSTISGSGGSSTGGTFSTTTSQVAGEYVNFPNNSTDILAVGSNSTTSAKFYFDPNISLAKIGGQVLVTGSTTLQNFVSLSSTSTQATSTNIFANTATFASLFANTANLTESGNLFWTQVRFETALAATTTLNNLTTLKGVSDFISTRGTTTSATSTSFFATTASSSNLFAGVFNGAGLSSCNSASNALTWNSGTFGCNSISGSSASTDKFASSTDNLFIYPNSITTSLGLGASTLKGSNALLSLFATTTTGNLINASSTTGFAGNFFRLNNAAGTELFRIDSTGALQTLASTTLQNFTALQSTSTNATSTNFFATTASSTNLFSSLLTVGQNTLIVNSAGNVGIGSSTPTARLGVKGIGATSATRALQIADSANRVMFEVLNDGSVNLGTNGANDQLFINSGANGGGLAITGSGGKGINVASDDNTSYLLLQRGDNTKKSSLIFSNVGGSIKNTIGMSGDDDLSFVDNFDASTPRFFMTIQNSTGNVAIGDTTPDRLLDVFDATNPQLRLTQKDGSVYTDLQTTNSGRFVVSPTSGYTGFGTSTPQWLLQLASSTAPQLALTDGAGTNHWTFRNAGGNLYVATSSPTTFATSTYTALTIDKSGFVGIGTSTPNTNLQVAGEVMSSSAGTTGQAAFFTTLNSLGNELSLRFAYSALAAVPANTWLFRTTGTSQDIAFTHFDDSVWLFMQTSTDNVGINTTGPDRKLDVLDSGGPQLRLTQTDGTKYTDFQTTSAGSLNISPSSGFTGFGTSTPRWLLQLASSTKAQLTLSDATPGDNHWSFRNAGGNLYVATSSPTTFATSTYTALTIDRNGLLTFQALSSTSTNATSTNFFATTASSTNLFAGVFNGAGLGTCNSASSALTWNSGTFGCNVITSGSPSTDKFSTSTNGVAIYPNGGTNIGLVIGGIATTTLSKFEVSGGAFFDRSTTTNATTTLFFATTASSTNLFSSSIRIDGTTLATSALHRVGVGTLNPGFKLDVVGDINFGDSSSLYTGGLSVFTASSTNSSTLVGIQAGSGVTFDGQFNTMLGYQAGFTNTSADNNTAIGFSALYNSTAGTNTAVGSQAGFNNTTGSANVYLGYNSGETNLTGTNNTLVGYQAGFNNNSATSTVALGYSAASGATTYSAQQLTVIGTEALANIVTGADGNTALGYRAGFNVGSGSKNILLGFQAGDALTSGSNNIILGYDIDAVTSTVSNSLNIGNIIFGSGVNGTGTALSNASIGIGTSTPQWLLQLASSTKAQLTLSDATPGDNHWSFRNAGGLLYIATSSPSTFATSTVTAFSIDQNGQITTSGNINGQTLTSAASFTGTLSVATSVTTPLMLGGSAAGSVLSLQSTSGNGTQTGTGIAFKVGNNGATVAATILNIGNFGIGTTTPNWTLQVASTTPYIALTDTDAATNKKHILLSNIDGVFRVGTSTDNLSSTSTALSLDPNSAPIFGLGTTSPWRTLSVTGTAAFDGLTSTGAGDVQLCLSSTKEVTTGAACGSSSLRFKHNVETLTGTSSLSEVLALRPVSFVYNGYQAENVGFIAEEIDKIDQRLVFYDDGTGTSTPRGVIYQNFVPILAGAIQELNLKVDALSGALTSSTSSLASIETIRGALGLNLSSISDGLNIDTQVTLSSGLKVDHLASVGDMLMLDSDTEFIGRPYFNNDMGGLALIEAGKQQVDINFDKPYIDAPVVSASVTLDASTTDADLGTLVADGMTYVVAHRSGTGFSIILSKPALKPVTFSWIALAIKDMKLATSATTTQPLWNLTPTPSPSPTPTPTPSPTPTPDPVPPIVTEASSTPPTDASSTLPVQPTDQNVDASSTPTTTP